MTDSIKKYDIGFTQIPNSMLCDPRLSERAKGIYAYLFSKPDGWQFHWNHISKELNCSQRVFRAVINELEQLGYITKNQANENGKFGGMIYEFVDVDRVTQNPHTVFKRHAQNGNTDSSNTDIPSNTNLENNPPIIPPQDDQFEEFWAKYIPVHTSKGPKKTAQDKFTRLTKTVNADEIIQGMERYIAECHKNNCYTKSATTFLNQEQWKDYLQDKQPEMVFSNPQPLTPGDYSVLMSAEDVSQVIDRNASLYARANPWLIPMMHDLNTELYNPGSLSCHQKSLQMALELAKAIFRHKDSPEIKNSLLDPLFWFSHRSVITEMYLAMKKRPILYIGYELARLVEEA